MKRVLLSLQESKLLYPPADALTLFKKDTIILHSLFKHNRDVSGNGNSELSILSLKETYLSFSHTPLDCMGLCLYYSLAGLSNGSHFL